MGEGQGVFALHFRRRAPTARGRDGGRDGEAGYVGLKSGKKLRGKGFQQVPPEDRLVVLTPGGAGIGDPAKRQRAAVNDDVESGLVSVDKAVAVYGYSR